MSTPSGDVPRDDVPVDDPPADVVPTGDATIRLGTVTIATTQDTFALRRSGKAVAETLGSDGQDAVRLATALSELSRDLVGADRLTADFDLRPGPEPVLHVTLSWRDGPGPAAAALDASARLLPTSHRTVGRSGRVRIEQRPTAPPVELAERSTKAARVLAAHSGSTALEDAHAQTRDLIAALEQTRAQGEDLRRLNDELEETNRGVLALYSQLSEELEETNRGVVALYAELDEKSRQLREASEAKTRFWANVSHELRTPVNAVVGLAELLLADADAPSEVRGHQLSLIADSGRTLLALVDELLDVAKAEAGNLEPALAPLDLRAVLVHLEDTLRGLAAPGVTLTITPPDGLGPVLGDETMLVRILRNLLSNALKFTATGSVRLDTDVARPPGAEEPGRLVLTVTDTGVGIPADQQEHVFEEFYQVKGPHQRGRSGTGLGLPYARRLTELLGGTLRLESEPGRGTVITVCLPLHPAPAGPVAPARLPVLVTVDDDPAFRAVLKPLLHRIADEVVEVADGRDALAAVRQARPDGIVLDLHMDEVDGYEVLARLRADPALRHIPVVVVTSESLDSTDRTRLGHARAVLHKPTLTSGRLAAALSAERAVPPPRRPTPHEDGS
ncbi:hybrid sensor histidine kinase/response regulator [Kitasatospora sp. NPDC056327]|uniref:ATP-binding response regulator n=1 Tax=Kitasatospora sp. NPDC056327 TaxID=3345785 RepID=UPI0035D802F1